MGNSIVSGEIRQFSTRLCKHKPYRYLVRLKIKLYLIKINYWNPWKHIFDTL